MWTNFSWESQMSFVAIPSTTYSFISIVVLYPFYSLLDFFSVFLSDKGEGGSIPIVPSPWNSFGISSPLLQYSSWWLSSCIWQKAVCYLNSYGVDFEGGLFHFQDGEPKTISPLCGVSWLIKAFDLFHLFYSVHTALFLIKKIVNFYISMFDDCSSIG